ncbi:hypothetical protein [Tenacibaculum amylolyticum]|uniref:hypothetical protein n=1 Tax=Tenacibaculum amylolyticum TaxID=104269 RepID=UPI0038949255
MKKKEINKILKTESAIILLQKESEHSLFEVFFSHLISIFSALYFLTRKKLDSLILTEKRFLLIIRNKILIEKKLNGNELIIYNSMKSTLEITTLGEKTIIELNKLRVSYEEGKLIKQKLNEFETKFNQKNSLPQYI